MRKVGHWIVMFIECTILKWKNTHQDEIRSFEVVIAYWLRRDTWLSIRRKDSHDITCRTCDSCNERINTWIKHKTATCRVRAELGRLCLLYLKQEHCFHLAPANQNQRGINLFHVFMKLMHLPALTQTLLNRWRFLFPVWDTLGNNRLGGRGQFFLWHLLPGLASGRFVAWAECPLVIS
jgi:hypothetical protein